MSNRYNGNNRYNNNRYDNSRYEDNNRRPRKKKKSNGLLIVLLVLIAILVLFIAVIVRDALTADPDSEPGFVRRVLAPITNPEPTPRPRTDVLTGIEHQNPLTGEPMDLGLAQYRPLAVVLNNISDSLPHNGVSDADIIYEYPVEGGLTRMLALYQDIADVELIGSIRSARHYTVQIAQSYDAILVGAGRSAQAQDEVRALGIPFLNEVEGAQRDVFFRDRNRIPGRRVDNLHAVVTTGERMMHWLPEYGFRLLHEQHFDNLLSFAGDATPQNGSNANNVVARLSSGKSSTFIFDAGEGTYHMHQYNRDFIDANDDSRPAFTNVLILKTSVTNIAGDASGRLNVTTTGSGDGYFISGGKYIEITWSRNNVNSPFYYTLRNGAPLELGIGKTFICITPNSLDPTFE